jgi:hypothetical protein
MSFLRLIELAERNIEELESHAIAHMPTMKAGVSHSVLISNQKQILQELKQKLTALVDSAEVATVATQQEPKVDQQNFELIDEQLTEEVHP